MISQFFVAVIGAGPAGLFGARELTNLGARVVLFNRDIKPGGLAEYGIYPNKHTMKNGLRKQFRQILELPNLDYYGNVIVGAQGDLTLDDLRALGFQAILGRIWKACITPRMLSTFTIICLPTASNPSCSGSAAR